MCKILAIFIDTFFLNSGRNSESFTTILNIVIKKVWRYRDGLDRQTERQIDNVVSSRSIIYQTPY